MKVAVIGAGLSSLSFARNLLKVNKEVSISLFEKSRGVGGRLATRRTTISESEVTFDHGAPYFTIRDTNFLQFAEKEEGSAVIQEWKASIKQINEKNEISELREQNLKRYIGCPGNNAIAKIIHSTIQKNHKNFTLNTQVQISKLKRIAPRQWKLITQSGEEISDTFELVVISAPAEQAHQIVKASEGFEAEQSKEKVLEKLSSFSMNPCWALMVAFKQPLGAPFDAAFINNPNSAFRWIANNSSKAQRRNSQNKEYDCWVAHTTVEWSKKNLEKSPEEVKNLLLHEMRMLMKPHVSQIDSMEPVVLEAHRWRYSIPSNAATAEEIKAPYVLYEDLGIGFVGDWCSAGRIEGAYMSGFHLAEFIKSKL